MTSHVTIVFPAQMSRPCLSDPLGSVTTQPVAWVAAPSSRPGGDLFNVLRMSPVAQGSTDRNFCTKGPSCRAACLDLSQQVIIQTCRPYFPLLPRQAVVKTTRTFIRIWFQLLLSGSVTQPLVWIYSGNKNDHYNSWLLQTNCVASVWLSRNLKQS